MSKEGFSGLGSLTFAHRDQDCEHLHELVYVKLKGLLNQARLTKKRLCNYLPSKREFKIFICIVKPLLILRDDDDYEICYHICVCITQILKR